MSREIDFVIQHELGPRELPTQYFSLRRLAVGRCVTSVDLQERRRGVQQCFECVTRGERGVDTAGNV
jgi:hypothetical protein